MALSRLKSQHKVLKTGGVVASDEEASENGTRDQLLHDSFVASEEIMVYFGHAGSRARSVNFSMTDKEHEECELFNMSLFQCPH